MKNKKKLLSLTLIFTLVLSSTILPYLSSAEEQETTPIEPIKTVTAEQLPEETGEAIFEDADKDSSILEKETENTENITEDSKVLEEKDELNLEDSSDEGKEEKIKEERDTPTETLEEETPENTEKPKEKTPEKTEDKEIKTTTDNKLSEKEDSLDENTSEESKEEPDKEILSSEEKTTEEFKCTDTIVKDEDKGVWRKIKNGDFFVEIKEGILNATGNIVGWIEGIITNTILGEPEETTEGLVQEKELVIESGIHGIYEEKDGSGGWKININPNAVGTTYYKITEINRYQEREIVDGVEGRLIYLDEKGEDTFEPTRKVLEDPDDPESPTIEVNNEPKLSKEELPGVKYDERIYYLKFEEDEETGEVVLSEVRVVMPNELDPFKELKTYTKREIADIANGKMRVYINPMDRLESYFEKEGIEGIEEKNFNNIKNIYDKDKPLIFENGFDLPTGEAEIGGNKNLTGKDLEEGEFEFVLKDRDGNIIGTVTNNKDGSFSFDIPVDHEGEFEFFLEEKNTGKANITYDGRIYKAVVRVCFDRLTNSLISEVVYIDEDGNELDLDKLPTFENEYEKPSEPTKPTKPTEPTKPTKPTEPSEPTKPTKPSEPTIPSEPTKPTKPTDSSVPTKETTVKKNGKDLPKTGMAGTIGISIIGLGLVLGGISQFKKKDD
ncbi:MAG: FctA domain-containing protein [Miniphocaeibacter sp.]|uniref:Spy0128 family protein n=1 Tax=Miniphocaeibacter sp. TaxID=3100973 RepID=UPI001818FC0C|nr:LPXTG cell wall anchor domain-containing protein [Gallicola sp.]